VFSSVPHGWSRRADGGADLVVGDGVVGGNVLNAAKERTVGDAQVGCTAAAAAAAMTGRI